MTSSDSRADLAGELAALALAIGTPVNAKRQQRYFGARLDGIRLVATDSDVRVGDGSRDVHLTSKEVLLVVTGRQRLAG